MLIYLGDLMDYPPSTSEPPALSWSKLCWIIFGDFGLNVRELLIFVAMLDLLRVEIARISLPSSHFIININTVVSFINPTP